MSADEQDQIAAFLDRTLDEVAAHRRGAATGFAETKHDAYVADVEASTPESESGKKMFTEDDIIHKDGKRWMEDGNGDLIELHPVFGCMKGTVTIAPGVDLTEPMEFEWSDELYNA